MLNQKGYYRSAWIFLALWTAICLGNDESLPVTENIRTTVVSVTARPINPDIDKENAGQEVAVTLDRPIPNCGSDLHYSVKGISVQDHVSANNVTSITLPGGKEERVTRVLGEDQTKLKFNWVPAIRGYAPQELKGVTISVNSYRHHVKVIDVKETAAEGKYEITFDRSFPMKKAQLVSYENGKPAYLSLDNPSYAPAYGKVKKATLFKNGMFQVANPKDLVGQDVIICSYGSLWDFSFGTSFGK